MAAFKSVVFKLANYLRFYVGLLAGVALTQVASGVLLIYILVAVAAIIGLLGRYHHDTTKIQEEGLVSDLREILEDIKSK